jgi:hypothetical protein
MLEKFTAFLTKWAPARGGSGLDPLDPPDDAVRSERRYNGPAGPATLRPERPMLSHLGNAPWVGRTPFRHPIERRKMMNAGQVAALGLGVALPSAQQQEPTYRAATRLVEVAVRSWTERGAR